MLPFAYFLLKVTICSAVLFCYYWFFLRNKVFHAYNRFYLMAIVVLSLTLPLCRINVFHKAEGPKTNMIKMLQVVTAGDEFLDKVIVSTKKKRLSFADITPLFYLTVSAVFLIMLLQMLLHIRSLKRNNENTVINDIHFINTDNGKGTPFSFFKYIFWNKNIDMHSPTGNRIFRHELAHIQERHSLDKMFINIILILFWCNPVFWFIRRELSMIHEFIADKRAVEGGDTVAFASMILAVSYPQHRFTITNNFFYSPIKRRLMMLTKKQNTRINYFSRLTVLPLLVILFAAFAIKAKTLNTGKNKLLNPVEKIINKIAGFNNEDKKENILTSSVSQKQISVVIDAGHGGEDAGGKNENGITEKELALQLVKKIKELNTNKNVHIILTRKTDKYSSPIEKAEFAKAQNPDLFISVHLDASPRANWNISTGMSVYVAKEGVVNTEKSKLFASAIIGAFQKNYTLAVPSLPMQRQKGIWVIAANDFPSVLIQAGFITNKKDAAYLTSEKGQETFAINVLNAINDFASSNNFSSKKALMPDNYRESVKANLTQGKINSDTETLINASQEIPLIDVSAEGVGAELKVKPQVMTSQLPNSKTHMKFIDPVFRVGNLSSGKVSIEVFKKQKVVTVTDDYEFVEATVYFSGEGFPKVISANLSGNKIENLMPLIDHCVAGTMITFDNISVKNHLGFRAIDGKAYVLY